MIARSPPPMRSAGRGRWWRGSRIRRRHRIDRCRVRPPTIVALGGRGDRRVQPSRLARRNRHFDLRQILRSPRDNLRQCSPPSDDLIQPAGGAVVYVVVLPRAGANVPQPGIQRVRSAGSILMDQPPVSSLTLSTRVHAAIRGSENPALRTRAEGVTQHRRVQTVGVFGIHGKIRNLLRIIEGQVRPAARILRPIDAIADR